MKCVDGVLEYVDGVTGVFPLYHYTVHPPCVYVLQDLCTLRFCVVVYVNIYGIHRTVKRTASP